MKGLRWPATSPRDSLAGAAVVSSLVVLMMVSFASRHAWDWFGVMSVLTAMRVPIVIRRSRQRPTPLAAGAQWLRYGDDWVRTYELVTATLAGPKDNRIRDLWMVDRDDRAMRISFNRLRESGPVWDLVYNGMLYSLLRGHADTNRWLRDRFPFR